MVYGSGFVFGIPHDAWTVLAVNTANHDIDVTSLDLRNLPSDPKGRGSGKWAGGVRAPNGKIYAISRGYNSAYEVLIIDPETMTFDLSLRLPSGSCCYSWSNGVLGADGRIYGVPWRANTLEVIDPSPSGGGGPTVQTLYSVGDSLLHEGSYIDSKFGGGALAWNGYIYAVPFNNLNSAVVS
eukprot:7388484-Prymnesium_polylepis.2